MTPRTTMLILLILPALTLLPMAKASVTIPTTTYFLVDGSYKNFPQEMTFNSVYSEAGVWYFDGKTYAEVLEDLAGALGKYRVYITVSVNYLPVSGATISISGQNQTTDLFGSTSWELAFGDYVIWAYCQGKNQSQSVSINQDRTLGFNFTNPILPPPPDNIRTIMIIAVIAVAAIMFLTFIKRRR